MEPSGECPPQHVMLSAALLGGSEASLDDVAPRQSTLPRTSTAARDASRPRGPLSMTASWSEPCWLTAPLAAL